MLLKERSKELGGEMRDAYGAALADLLQTNDKIMILDSDLGGRIPTLQSNRWETAQRHQRI